MSVSKFDRLPFNCYEVAHTWSPHCGPAALLVGYHGFKESLKIYASCYLISRVATKRIPRSFEDFLNFVEDVVRSSLFLAMNGYGFVTAFCWLRKILGPPNFFTAAFLPSLLACYVAILVEKPSRRPLLALYVTNVASETIFLMLRSRGIVHNVKYFDLALFAISATTMMHQMRNGCGRNDVIGSIFTKIMGREEFSSPKIEAEGLVVQAESKMAPIAMSSNNRKRSPDTKKFLKLLGLWVQKFVADFEKMTTTICNGRGRHDTCPHKNCSCTDYWMRGLWTRFASGFGLQFVIQFLSQLRHVVSQSTKNSGKVRNNFEILRTVFGACLKSGIGLSSICLAFRLISCSSRWLTGSQNDPRGSIVSGLVSTSLGFYLLRPPSTLALYLFFKTIENVISESHKSKNWRIISWLNSVAPGGGWSLLYAVSTAILFHTAVMEPQNLKPSYLRYLSRVSGGKLLEINRHLLSVYGTGSDLTMKNFWPDYDMRYLSNDMKQIIERRETILKGGEGLLLDTKELMKQLTQPFLIRGGGKLSKLFQLV